MTVIEDEAFLFSNATGIKLWADKSIDIASLTCPYCQQERPVHKNIENFLNYLHDQYSKRYSVERGMIIWHEDDKLEEIEPLLEEKTGNFVSEFLPYPLFLTKEFDYDTYPEYQMKEKGLYLIAFVRAFYDMPETFEYVYELVKTFEILEWYAEYIKRHFEEDCVLWYEMVDQFGTNLLPLTQVRSMDD